MCRIERLDHPFQYGNQARYRDRIIAMADRAKALWQDGWKLVQVRIIAETLLHMSEFGIGDLKFPHQIVRCTFRVG